MSKYMVTGGAGFIGSHLVEHLLKAGHDVCVVDNFSTGYRHNLSAFNGHVELFEIDIRDQAALAKAMQGVEFVFHQAALASVPQSIQDPVTNYEVNVMGTLNVLVAARDAGVQRVVFAGSSAAYGDTPAEIKTEDMRPEPKVPYASAKVASEDLCRVFNTNYPLETVILRYFNVFGPRQDPNSAYAAVIPLFATAMIQDQAPTIFGDGSQSRDFTFIENIVNGNLKAMHSPQAPGEIFNIATGQSLNLIELVDGLNSVLGKQINPIFAPPRTGDILHSRASIDKAGALLGFEPSIDFETGLKRTLDWYSSQNAPR